MNKKIKNYVDVLFADIPNTRRASELKEEILSNLNDHFNEHMREGKTENQAYTDAISDLGDIDEILKSLVPEKETQEKIEIYRKKKAKNIAIAVSLYIVGAICLIAPPALASVFEFGNEDQLGVIGLIVLLLFAAVATGLIIYTNMSIPQDVAPFVKKGKNSNEDFDESTDSGKFMASFMKIYWLIVTVIYLLISFKTFRWDITWIIWIIGAAVKEAIVLFFRGKNIK